MLAWKGRCPRCHQRIGPAAGIVEVVLAVILGLLTWRIIDPLTLATFTMTAVITAALAFIDVAVHRLPDRLTLPAIAVTITGLTGTALLHDEHFRLLIGVLSALTMVVVYLSLSLIPHGYGVGDVKLAPVVGLTAGWYGFSATIAATLIAFLLAGLTATVLMLLGRHRRSRVPHGPFMLIGAYIVILVAN